MLFRSDIQGLRAIAVMAVLCFHFKIYGFEGGYVGVDIFFVISGFLMTSIILKSIGRGSFSYLDFLWSRAVRIYPPMLVLLLVTLSLGYFFLNPQDYAELAKNSLSAVASLGNVRFYVSTLDYFAPAQQTNWLLHLWSLAIEFQFYFVYPLILWAGAKFGRIGFVLILVFILSFSISVALTMADQSASFFLLPSRVWEFVAGGLAFVYGSRLPDAWRKFTLAFGLGLIFICILTYRESMAFPGWIAIVPVLGTSLVISARIENLALSNGLLQFLGRISYSVYLWHWPLWVAFQQYRVPVTAFSTCVLLLLSILLGWISYRFIEVTANRQRQNGARRFAALVATGGACLIVAFSASTVVAKQGFPSRVPPEIRDVVAQFKSDIVKLPRAGVCFLTLSQGEGDFEDKCFTRNNGDQPTVFIWGDSYAAHIWFGLNTSPIFEGTNLLGATSSGCFPVLGAPSKFNKNCDENNKRALKEIERLKPDTVILDGRWVYAEQEAFDLERALAATVDYLLTKNLRVVVIGPSPEWLPSLSQLLLQESFARGGIIPDRMLDASQEKGRLLDKNLSQALNGKGAKYISLYQMLCNADGCMTTVPRGDRSELMVYDFGHLTVPAAEYIVNTAFVDGFKR